MKKPVAREPLNSLKSLWSQTQVIWSLYLQRRKCVSELIYYQLYSFILWIHLKVSRKSWGLTRIWVEIIYKAAVFFTCHEAARVFCGYS